MKTDILIIGAGISGLHTAYQLQKLNKDFLLVEARENLGGRIVSCHYQSDSEKSINADSDYKLNEPAFDLGPSWFWPGQSRIQDLINELNLNDSVFNQNSEGQSVFEDQQGNVQQGFFGISMEGTYRLNGGMQQITSSLGTHIEAERILKSTQVISVEKQDKHLLINLKKLNNKKNTQDTHLEIKSNKVLIAMPPRLAVSNIEFTPNLSQSRIDELNSYATWMAGHAKVIVSYSSPFWLEQGFSGDAVSHLGPMREIHDASSKPNDKNQGYALFGFVGIPGSYRKGNEDEIKKDAVAQLIRLFGEQAAKSTEVVLKDWSQEKFTATEIDQSMTGGHANSSIRDYTDSTFNDCLIWSGTETADHLKGYNGLIEGALEASERSLELIKY